jgi:flavin-dependent dehydrogenase
MVGSGRRRVLVVGGGPAGAAAAVQLARAGHATMIVERTCGNGWRAGETLPPVAAEVLRALGVWERFLADGHRPSKRTATAWGDGRLHLERHLFNPHGSGWHVDRERFDGMLVAAAEEAGAQRYRGARVTSVERSERRWRVVVSAGGVRTVEECDWLVDATGRGAALARMLGERWIDDDRTVAIVGRLAPVAPGAPVEEALLVESAERGWWYSAMLPDGTLLAAYLTDGDEIDGAASDCWHMALAPTSHTAARARGFAVTDIRVRRASTGCVTRAAGRGWVAVGDAAMAHDPLSGQGLVHALATGMRGAAALWSGGDGVDAYRDAVWTRRQAYLRQRADVYRRETRWPASSYWLRRQAIDRAAIDRPAIDPSTLSIDRADSPTVVERA